MNTFSPEQLKTSDMKIDFDHWQGSQIADEIKNQQYLEMQLSIIKALSPVFSMDGNQYCFLYGTLPNDCIVGFGDTPHDAMVDFVKSYYNQKAHGNSVKHSALNEPEITDEEIERDPYCDCKPHGRFNSVGVCVMCKREYR
jgi:hypothetical protein